MPAWPGFIGGSYESQSVIGDAERTMNWYVEELESEGARAPKALYPSPGFQAHVGLAHGITDVNTRGFGTAGSRFFAVIGAGFYEIFSNQTVTRRGTVAQDAYPATISYNGRVGDQLFVTSGGNGYCYNLTTNALTLVLTGEATMGAYAHGYCLAFNINNGHVRLSNLNDASVWGAGNFFQRSYFADPWQAMFVDANSLAWMLGTETYEVWYDTSTGQQPFALLSGMVGRPGVAAPFAWTLAGSAALWLAQDAEGAGQVVAGGSGGVRPISTYAVNQKIAGYARNSTINDAEVFAYQDQGHTFSCLTFPTANATQVVDLDRRSWTQRGYWNSALNRYDLWRPRVHGYAFGKHFIGDRLTGTVSWMDRSFVTEADGAVIRRQRVAPGITHEHQRHPIDQIELLMETGVGVPLTAGSDPVAMMRFSGDGGWTWSSERTCATGKQGEYRRRVYWTRCGAPMDAMFELTISDPAPARVIGAWLNNLER